VDRELDLTGRRRPLKLGARELPVPDLNPYVAEHAELPHVVRAEDAPGWRGRWSEIFGRTAPLHLEIGSGNGFYLSGMAAAHPEADWLGLEIRYKRVVLAARKLERAGLANARVLRWDAFQVDSLFEPGSLAGVHVNHPDPWPRRTQSWRRLIGRPFVEVAARLLAPGGELRLKTDFPPHVDALLASLPGLPLELVGRSEDVRAQGAPWADEVRTNYQRKFDERGVPVLAVRLRRA